MGTLHTLRFLVAFFWWSHFAISVIESHPPPVAKPELRPVSVQPGKRCNFKMYNKFFTELHKTGNKSLVQFLLEGTFVSLESEDGEPQKYLDFLDDLCIYIGEDKVVDPFAYDCNQNLLSMHPGDFCVCGAEMNEVDPNVKSDRPAPTTYEEIILYKTVGLNRKLVMEQNECLSYRFGHCNESLPIPLKCASGLKCQHYRSRNQGKEIINQKTKTMYGVCRKFPPDDDSGVQERIADETDYGGTQQLKGTQSLLFNLLAITAISAVFQLQ